MSSTHGEALISIYGNFYYGRRLKVIRGIMFIKYSTSTREGRGGALGPGGEGRGPGGINAN